MSTITGGASKTTLSVTSTGVWSASDAGYVNVTFSKDTNNKLEIVIFGTPSNVISTYVYTIEGAQQLTGYVQYAIPTGMF